MWNVIESRGQLLVVSWPPKHAKVLGEFETEQGAKNYRDKMLRRATKAKRHHPFALLWQILLAGMLVWIFSWMLL